MRTWMGVPEMMTLMWHGIFKSCWTSFILGFLTCAGQKLRAFDGGHDNHEEADIQNVHQ